MTDAGDGNVVATYVVDVAGTSIVIAVTGRDEARTAGPAGPGSEGVRIDGATIPAALIETPGSPIRLLRLGDAVYEVVSERGEERGAYTVALRGVRLSVEALDERARAIRSMRGKGAASAAAGPEVLRAPMPGMVSRVLVAQGAEVAAGDGLIVIESMKMENELRARSAGRVRSIRVAPGTAVEKGAVLIELE
jgi:biotin carboxyl carrier protein